MFRQAIHLSYNYVKSPDLNPLDTRALPYLGFILIRLVNTLLMEGFPSFIGFTKDYVYNSGKCS